MCQNNMVIWKKKSNGLIINKSLNYIQNSVVLLFNMSKILKVKNQGFNKQKSER